MSDLELKNHPVVSRTEWLAARIELAKEKEFTRVRDQLARQRRDLPWERVDKKYTFDGPKGKETLSALFDGNSQLIVYHFMFDPEWEAGCKSCSFWADNFTTLIFRQRGETKPIRSRTLRPGCDGTMNMRIDCLPIGGCSTALHQTVSS